MRTVAHDYGTQSEPDVLPLTPTLATKIEHCLWIQKPDLAIQHHEEGRGGEGAELQPNDVEEELKGIL